MNLKEFYTEVDKIAWNLYEVQSQSEIPVKVSAPTLNLDELQEIKSIRQEGNCIILEI